MTRISSLCQYNLPWCKYEKSDLDKNEEEKSIMTRTFLSSSTDRDVEQSFLIDYPLDLNSNYRVICMYHVRNPCIAIDVQTISAHPSENEILIISFITFEITSAKKNFDGISYIELDQCGIDC